MPCRAKRDPGDERRHEAVQIPGQRQPVHQQCQPDRRHGLQCAARPAAALGDPQKDPAEGTGDDPEHNRARDGEQFGNRPGAVPVTVADRQREHDREDRRGESVVEAALDVEGPPDPARDVLVLDHGRAQGGVGRSDDHGQQQGNPAIDPMEDHHCNDRADGDRQRQPDEQQARRDPGVRAQSLEVDAGRVGEQHHRQRELGGPFDRVTVQLHVDDLQGPAGQHQAKPDKQHGRRDSPPLEPHRQQAPDEDAPRRDRESGGTRDTAHIALPRPGPVPGRLWYAAAAVRCLARSAGVSGTAPS